MPSPFVELEVGGRVVKVTNPHKIFYSARGETKLDGTTFADDDAVCDLRALLQWVERDEKEGLGEAPYPPNFPKMPGEPRRVQPSRAKERR